MKSSYPCILAMGVLMLFDVALNAKIVLRPIDDTFIRGNTKADSIYGAPIAGFNTTEWNYLRVRSTATAPDNVRNLLIKFDLTSITENVSLAILKLTVNFAAGPSAGTGKLDHADFYKVTDDNWSEITTNWTNWNKTPKVGTKLFGKSFTRKTKTDGLPDPTYYFDITNYVKAELAGDKMLTMYATDDSVNGTDLRFYSKEFASDTSRPQLIIETGSTGMAQQVNQQPDDFRILQNYPNPFNPETWISFELPRTNRVTMDVLDVRGHRVIMLENRPMAPGVCKVHWDGLYESGESASAGVYFARVRAGGQIRMVKMLLVK